MNYKRLPNGISDFAQLRKGNFYYVDKTMYITAMENTANFLFFTRPRRFGKSLFVSMVREYYDTLPSAKYEKQFKGTAIYRYNQEHKDEPGFENNHGKYQILYFDFSKVKGKSVEEIEHNFNLYCSNTITRFLTKYNKYYDDVTREMISKTDDAGQKLNALAMSAQDLGHSLYIIVDEYDNFTNNILTSMGLKTYTDITHGTGFYRDFLKIFKAIASRYLLMGISPCTLDDVTSGFNNFVNITADPDFNMALGFSEVDVREMIGYYQQAGLITRDTDDIINEMRPWYDNYCFAPSRFGIDPKVFNSDMVLYYLGKLMKLGKAPSEMVDPNTMTDYGKLKGLVRLDTENEERKNDIREIASQGYMITKLVGTFPAQNMIKPEMFPSLLYYYGMLTIGGIHADRLKLIIPNLNVRVQYYNFLLEFYQQDYKLNTKQLSDFLDGAAIRGDWQPLMNYLTSQYKKNASVRDTIQGERHLQGYLLAYFNLTSLFITYSEYEMSNGYCDLALFGNHKIFEMATHSYIIELKYLKSTATAAEAQAQWDEAVAQLHRYATDEKALAQTQGTTLHLIALQMRGQQLERMEEVK